MSNDSQITSAGLPKIEDDEKLSPVLRLGLAKPHIALLAGINEWIPIVEGCTIALVTDRSKLSGIAPYVITKMSWKPGKEEIHLTAVGETGTVRRILKLGSRYMGHHTQSTEDSDKLIDAAVNAKKTAADE